MLTKNNVIRETKRRQESSGSFSFSLGMILIGVLLILSSFLSLGDLAAHSQWTEENAVDFATLSEKYHRSAYQAGSKEAATAEQKHQNQKLKTSFEAMRNELERAQEQPQRWSHYLLVVGVLLTVAGFFAHSTRQYG